MKVFQLTYHRRSLSTGRESQEIAYLSYPKRLVGLINSWNGQGRGTWEYYLNPMDILHNSNPHTTEVENLPCYTGWYDNYGNHQLHCPTAEV